MSAVATVCLCIPELTVGCVVSFHGQTTHNITLLLLLLMRGSLGVIAISQRGHSCCNAPHTCAHWNFVVHDDITGYTGRRLYLCRLQYNVYQGPNTGAAGHNHRNEPWRTTPLTALNKCTRPMRQPTPAAQTVHPAFMNGAR